MYTCFLLEKKNTDCKPNSFGSTVAGMFAISCKLLLKPKVTNANLKYLSENVYIYSRLFIVVAVNSTPTLYCKKKNINVSPFFPDAWWLYSQISACKLGNKSEWCVVNGESFNVRPSWFICLCVFVWVWVWKSVDLNFSYQPSLQSLWRCV